MYTIAPTRVLTMVPSNKRRHVPGMYVRCGGEVSKQRTEEREAKKGRGPVARPETDSK